MVRQGNLHFFFFFSLWVCMFFTIGFSAQHTDMEGNVTEKKDLLAKLLSAVSSSQE